jgi:hypothetical protein
MAALAALPGVIAHGGIAGAIAESLVAISIAAVLVAVWIRERRVSRLRDEDQREA